MRVHLLLMYHTSRRTSMVVLDQARHHLNMGALPSARCLQLRFSREGGHLQCILRTRNQT